MDSILSIKKRKKEKSEEDLATMLQKDRFQISTIGTSMHEGKGLEGQKWRL